MKQKLPKHVLRQYGTARKFKQAKRKELREAIKAVDTLMCGSYYIPCYPILKSVQYELKCAQEKMSIINWGN